MIYSQEEKLDILKQVYHELHNSRRRDESFENKIAFSFGTLFLLFAGIVLKGGFQLEGITTYCAVFLVIAATIVACWFLIRNGRLIRIICRMIVRIEQVLGLHSDDTYISQQELKVMGYQPFPDARIFPKEVERWGMSTRWQAVTPHLIIVISAGLTALVAVLSKVIL